MATQPSLEELRRAFTLQSPEFDPRQISQGAIAGTDLANSILTRKQAQEDRERALREKIEAAKRQRGLSKAVGGLKLPEGITPEVAEAAALEAPADTAKQISQKIFDEGRQTGVPRGGQFVGTAGGQGVVFDPNTSTFKNVPLPTGGAELQPRVAPTIPDSQLNEVIRLGEARDQLLRVKELFSPEATGPVQARLQDFAIQTGVDTTELRGLLDITDEKTRFRTVLQSSINDYIKAITGAQMSEPEAKRIMKALPARGSADEAFLPALNEILRITEEKVDRRERVLKAAGFRNIGGIADALPKPGTPAPAASTGNPGQIDALAGVLGLKKKATAGGQ